MSAIDPDRDDAIDDAMLFAEMLVLTDAWCADAASEIAFWDTEARALLAGLILYAVVAAPKEGTPPTLTEVRKLLTAPESEFAKLLERMQSYANDRTTAGTFIARAASRQLQKADKERSGVVSTAQSHTHFLDSPRMAKVLATAGIPFTLDALKTTPMSLYLILPAERMSTYQRWLRIMIASSLLAITRTRGLPRHRVLFVLDEFAQLGRMRPVEDTIALVGGYGASFWLFLQDLSQLKAIYRDKWETFEGNVHVLQAFGVNDLFTAKHLSERLGERTIFVESENQSAGISRGRTSTRQRSAASTTAEKGRRLLTPDEVMRLPAGEQLLFLRGRSPIRARTLDYRTDPEFAGLAAPNPMHDGAEGSSLRQRANGVSYAP